MILRKNMVIKTVSENGDNNKQSFIRIVLIDSGNQYAYVVSLNGEGSFPYAISVNDLENGLDAGKLTPTGDPFAQVWEESNIPQNLRDERKVLEYCG